MIRLTYIIYLVAPAPLKQIILVFEGIDHFVDQEDLGKEANVAFWLPRVFPKRIKVLVTCSKDSPAM